MENTCASGAYRESFTLEDFNQTRTGENDLQKDGHFICLKGTVHPKMNILSSFIQPQVDPNLYECVCSEHKGRYSEE